MDLTQLFKSINENWAVMAVIFGLGGSYYQAKIWFRKITALLQNTSKVHSEQNIMLDNMNDKLETLDKRIARIENNIDDIQSDHHEQAIKLAVLESANGIDNGATPIRRTRRTQ